MTTKIVKTSFRHNGVDYVLVDTPGFDDSAMDDDVVVLRILEWLQGNFGRNRKLDGIIYLHGLDRPRMSYSSRLSLRTFRALCGDDALHRVILGTTFWDVAPHAEAREQELCASHWKGLIDKGASTARIYLDRNSGLRQLERLADLATTRPGGMHLLSQQEISEGGVDLRDTQVFRQSLRGLQGSSARQKQEAQFESDRERERLMRERALDAQTKNHARETRPLKRQLKALTSETVDVEREAGKERRRLEKKHEREKRKLEAEQQREQQKREKEPERERKTLQQELRDAQQKLKSIDLTLELKDAQRKLKAIDLTQELRDVRRKLKSIDLTLELRDAQSKLKSIDLKQELRDAQRKLKSMDLKLELREAQRKLKPVDLKLKWEMQRWKWFDKDTYQRLKFEELSRIVVEKTKQLQRHVLERRPIG